MSRIHHALRAAAGASGGGWTPAEITTALWLDAADASTLTLDGSGNVEVWADKSGNGHDASQSSSSRRPEYLASGSTLEPSIGFDGVDDFLQTVGWYSVDTSVPHTYIALAKFNSLSGARVLIAQEQEGGAGESRETGLLSTDSGFDKFIYGQRTGGSNNCWATADNTVNPGIFIGITDNSVGSVLYHDGTKHGANSECTNLINNESYVLNIGARAVGNYFEGLGAEFLILPYAIGDSDRQSLEGYLAHKWGLTDNLPSDHPYKTSAP